MRLLAVGRGRQGPEAEILQRYAARLKPRLTLIEFNDGFGSAAEIKRREAADLLAAVTAKDFVIALDQAGEAPSSPELAAADAGRAALPRPDHPRRPPVPSRRPPLIALAARVPPFRAIWLEVESLSDTTEPCNCSPK